MKIDIQSQEASIEHVRLTGDLDFNTSPEVRRELGKIVDKRLPKVLIDLEKVSYIDSSGLATFIELFQKMKRFGGKLVLYNLNSGVRSVFEIAKLDTIFQIAGNREQALTFVS